MKWLARILHLTFSQAHRGIWSLYTCCHECGKPAERIAIPFYPCPCIFARQDLLELKRLSGRVRIEEHPDYWCVEYGDHLQHFVGRETIEAAAKRALEIARDWQEITALVPDSPEVQSIALLDRSYDRCHQPQRGEP